MKKPDATTIITADNFREKVWPLPVGELLYVGRSTRRKLQNRAIYTIGDLANRDISDLKLLLGIRAKRYGILQMDLIVHQ
jgi:DNA polymerase-4